jgi:DNA polymerase-4
MDAKLAQLGIATVGQLRDRGAAELERRFGRWGRRLHELSLGIDEHPVVSERPTLQVSSEDTFERDLTLSELEPHIIRMAGRAWTAYERERSRDPDRSAHTVVLKLKTSDFRIITRSLTPATPPPTLAHFAALALDLCQRVGLPSRTRYRLVGVGLGNFHHADEAPPQRNLFADGERAARSATS